MSDPSSDRTRLEDELRYVLALVNEWLRFGETKNAALLAANLSLAVAALKLDATANVVQVVVSWAPWSAALFLASALVGLIAFAPRTNIPGIFPHRGASDHSVLFFGDIAACSPKAYLEQLQLALGITDAPQLAIHEHFSQQIVTNAQIAALKHRVFGIAMWATVAALITPIGALMLYLIGIQLRR